MSPRRSSMAPSYRAAHAVLELPELLEAILLRLPIKDLLLSQRVSRTWQATVSNSLALRKALFFEADGTADGFESSSCSFNPLLGVPVAYKTIILPISLIPSGLRLDAESLAPKIYDTDLIPSAPSLGAAVPCDDTKDTIEKIASYVLRNGKQFETLVRGSGTTKVASLWPEHEHHAYYQWRLAQLQEDRRPLLRAKAVAHLTRIEPAAWLRADASWRKMFVTRPAVKQLGGVAQVRRPCIYRNGVKEIADRLAMSCNFFDQSGVKGEEVLRRADQLRDSKPLGLLVSIELQERLTL